MADWVSDEDGTGIVHLAPGFGEDDQVTCEAAGIELVVPVDDSGRFTSEVPDWAGGERLRRQPGDRPHPA
ncbi:MAG: class I tRNA ligase family protein [Microthrixaceae bacterium]|nr:class I tRNA ligase family protein [Microthrixaceae bacterium]